MADRYWVGDTDGDWNDASNWASSSGGAGGAGVPTSSDAVIFDDQYTTQNCTCDVAIDVASIDVQSTYDGKLDFGDSAYAHQCAGDVDFDGSGEIDMGDCTFTVSGNFDNYDQTTFTYATSTLVMDGTTKTITQGKDLYGLTISGTITRGSSTAGVRGPLVVSGTFTNNSNITIQTAGDIQVTGTGTWNGSGGIIMGSGGSISQMDGTWNPSGTLFADYYFDDCVPAYYDCAVRVRSTSGSNFTNTMQAGTYRIGGTFTFSLESSGNFTIDNSVNNTNYIFEGNVTFSDAGAGTLTWTKGTGSITLSGAGSGTQTIDFDGKTIEDLTMNDSGATKTIDASGFTTDSLTLTAGTWDCATNNPSLTINGNCTMDCTRVDMGSGTWTCSGDFDCEDVTTFNDDTSTIEMSGASKALKTPDAQPIYNLTIKSTASVTWSSADASKRIQMKNNLTIEASGSLTLDSGNGTLEWDTSAAVMTINGTLTINQTLTTRCDWDVGATGTINGSGTWNLNGYVTTPLTVASGGTVSVSPLTIAYYLTAHTLAAGTIASASVTLKNSRGGIDTLTAAAGTIAFSGAVTFTTDTAFTWTVDFSANNPTVNLASDVTFTDGTGDIDLSLGNGTWTCSGNWSHDGISGGWSADASTVVLNGTGKTVKETYWDEGFNNLTIDGTISVANGESALIVNGNLIVNANKTFTAASGRAIRVTGASADLQINTGASLTGDGSLLIGTSASISQQDGTLDIASLDLQEDHNADIVPATYGSATVTIRNTGGSPKTFTWAAGTYTFSGNVTIDTTGAGAYIVTAATNNPTLNFNGNLTMQSSGAGALTFVAGSSTYNCAGDVDLSGVDTLTRGNSTLTMSGTSKTLALPSAESNAIANVNITGTIEKTGSGVNKGTLNVTGTLTMTGSWTFDTAAGAVEIENTGTLTGAGSITIKDGASIDKQDGTWSVTNTYVQRGAQLIGATYGGTWLFEQDNTSTNTVTMGTAASQTFTFSGPVTFDHDTASGAYTIENATYNPDYVFQDNVTITESGGGTLTWTKGSGYIKLSGAGSGSQTIALLGKSVEGIQVDDDGATKVFDANGFTSAYLDVVRGDVDFDTNNPDVTLTGILDVLTAASVTVNFTFGSGNWTVGGNIRLRAGATATLNVVGPDGIVTFADDFYIHGNVNYTNGSGSWKASGAGSGTQSITTDGQTIEHTTIDDSGATKQLQDDLNCVGMTVNGGTLDTNGQDVITAAGFSVEDGGRLGLTGLVGTRFTVGGNGALNGQVGNLLPINPSGVWYWDVAGTNTANYVTAKNSDASGSASQVQATNSVDEGGNINWNFEGASETLIMEDVFQDAILQEVLQPAIA